MRELVARLPAQVANLAAKAAELEEQLEAAVDGRAGEAAPKPLCGKDPLDPRDRVKAPEAERRVPGPEPEPIQSHFLNRDAADGSGVVTHSRPLGR